MVRAGDGITADDVLDLVGDETKKLTPTKILRVTKRGDGTAVWLEEGLTEAEAIALNVKPSGWKHIREDHFPDLEAANQFAEVFGEEYRDENKIRELIMNGAKYGQKISDTGVYHYIEPSSGEILQLIIGSNGYIVTAYPFRVK